MTEYGQINEKKIISYLESGCKTADTPFMIGLELEHFIVDKESERSLPFYGEKGIETLLRHLEEGYDKKAEEKGHLIALEKQDILLSLEPAAQLEVSIAPKTDIDEIIKVYHDFSKEITPYLNEMGAKAVTCGYQPADCANELELIPKDRYVYMDRYFEKIGPYGRQMMRATASAQVAIDYYSKEDLMLKYRLAYALLPQLAGLTSNTPYYEGKPYRGSFLRKDIWLKTDEVRVNVEPFMKDGTIDFAGYVQFVKQAPVIVNKDNSREYYCEETIGSIMEKRELSEEEIVHVLSMVFPAIRIKKYLEIRVADSMPIEATKYYLLLMKGLFINAKDTWDRLLESDYFGMTWEAQRDVLLTIACDNLQEKEQEEFLQKKDKIKDLGSFVKAVNMTVNELNKWCKENIEKNPVKHLEGAKASFDYLDNSTAKYKGKTIYSLYIPKLLLPENVAYLKDIAQTMVGIMQKVIKEYLDHEDYRKLFGFSKEMEELITNYPGYDCLLPVTRVDIFWNEEKDSFMFCEFNTDGSSAMNEDRELCIAFEKTYLYEQLREKYQVSSFELFDSLVNAFMEIYETYPNRVKAPRVAIVDFLELGCSMEEFEQFRLAFEKAGYEACVCDIRKLCYNGEALCTSDGKQIDLIYRRAVTSDILEHKEEVTDFINAVKNQHVCCMGNFCTQVVHDKSLFYILHMERTMQFLTKEEQEFVKEHIPFTAELTGENIEKYNLIADKDKWLIKPKNSYGARGIFAGINLSAKEWEKQLRMLADSNYIFQVFIMPYQTVNVDYHKEYPMCREYSNLTGLYVYNGKFAGVYSRQSKFEIISGAYDENDIATICLKPKEC